MKSDSSTDPLLVGLIGIDKSNGSTADLSEDPPPMQPVTPPDSMVETAEQLRSRLLNPSSSETESLTSDQPTPEHSVQGAPWNGFVPDGAIVAANGEPFTDWNSASFQAQTMQRQTGLEFIVQALSSDRFAVIVSSAVPFDPSMTEGTTASEPNDRAYLDIPVDELKLSDFPPEHPVHRCGLSRYKRYMKKNFKFKPSYRSMWPLMLIVPFSAFVYFYPIVILNLLPPDVVASLVKSVPPEQLAQGVSVFGALLAAFASGRILFQRHYTRYMLNPGFAKLEEGILKRESTKIAYINIVNYDVKQGIIGRLLNFGNIELSSAGSDGAEIEMHSVFSPRLVEVVLEGKMVEAKKARL
jgi:membrane protein YdbS with pleckstrin-like domain